VRNRLAFLLVVGCQVVDGVRQVVSMARRVEVSGFGRVFGEGFSHLLVRVDGVGEVYSIK